MQKHTKIYIDHFGYCEQDWIGCEKCNGTSVDIHHLDSKGMGGTSLNKDYIENLMALCRDCHNKAHASIQFNQELKVIHLKHLENHNNFSHP